MSVGEKQSSLILFHPWPVFFPSERSSSTLHSVLPPPTLGDAFWHSHRNHRAACRCDGADHACCGTRIAGHRPLAHLFTPRNIRPARGPRILRRLLRRLPRQSGGRSIAGCGLFAIPALRVRMERTLRLARGRTEGFGSFWRGEQSFRDDRQCLHRLAGMGWEHAIPLPSLSGAKSLRRQIGNRRRPGFRFAILCHASRLRFARFRRPQFRAGRPRTQLDFHRQRLGFVVCGGALAADEGDRSHGGNFSGPRRLGANRPLQRFGSRVGSERWHLRRGGTRLDAELERVHRRAGGS